MIFKKLFIIFIALLSDIAVFAKDIYITNPVAQLDFQSLPKPKDRRIPLDVKYFNDKNAAFACSDLDENKFKSVAQDFNPGFYTGVLWIQVQFPDTQVLNGKYYNLSFGLSRFNYAEVFRYDKSEKKWTLAGRTGVNLSKNLVTYATWIPSVLIDETDFENEENHILRIRMISYNGSSVSLRLIPSSIFDYEERAFIIWNSIFISLSIALFLLILFLGIFIKDKLYIAIGIITALLYGATMLLWTSSPTGFSGLLKNTSGVFVSEHLISLINLLTSTLMFVYIIRDGEGEKKYSFYLFSNLAYLAVSFIFLAVVGNPKTVYIAVNIAAFCCDLNLIFMWATNRKVGRQTSYTILDAWVFTLIIHIITRNIKFAETISGETWSIANFVFSIPENLIFFISTIPALAITARRYRDNIAKLHTNIMHTESENHAVTERLELRRAVDKILISSNNSIRNMISMLQKISELKNETVHEYDIILSALTRGINLLTMESILETGTPLENQSLNLEDEFKNCIEKNSVQAAKKNVTIKSVSEGIKNKSILINRDVFEFLINNTLGNSIKLCSESSRLEVHLKLEGNFLEFETDMITDSDSHRYTFDLLQKETKSNEIGFTLLKKLLECYGGTFSTKDLGDGYKFKSKIQIEWEPTGKNIVTVKKSREKEGIGARPMDELLSIDGKVPSILFAIEDDVSRLLIESSLSRHCYLYTVDSGSQAFKMLTTALALGNRLPDMIISDYSLPAVTGIELLRKCNSEDYLKDIPFVFILPSKEEKKINSLLSLGAVDCIITPFSTERLYKTIYTIYAMSHKIRRSVVNQVQKTLMGNQDFISPQQIHVTHKADKKSLVLTNTQSTVFSQSGLSSREKQIALLISEGLSDKEISERLNISLGTVTSHNKNIFKKMNIHSRIELVNKVR